MLLTVLIPEYIMGKAWGDRQAAVAVRDLFRSRNLIEGGKSTFQLGFFTFTSVIRRT